MFGKKKQEVIQQPKISQSMMALKQGSVALVDILAPSSIEVDFKYIRVGDNFFRTFFVVDYPRVVSPNWLSGLIDFKESMDISMFIYPIQSSDVLSNIRRKIAEMEATIESDVERGLEPDPKTRAALEDAMSLQEELARGLERFFQFGLYITLSAKSAQELDDKTRELKSLLAGSLLVVKAATLQMEDGFKTTLPMGEDKLYITRNMDTTSVASTFPFTSYELSQPTGILYGINSFNNSLILIDRFQFENANEVIFGKSGSGKSFLAKLEVLRQEMFDAEIIIIDPEGEYKTLSDSLGGEYIAFSSTSPVKINPFSLNPEDVSESQLGIKILALHGLIKTMVGDLTPAQEAFLDRSLVLIYKQKGITPDPATYKGEPPILEDLYKTLLNMEEQEAKDIAFRLEKYIKGGFAGLFNQQTNYDFKNQLTVFGLKQLEDALRPIAMHIILDFIWNKVKTKLKKRILFVDEAWYLMKHPDSAAFLQGIAKRARKYYLGVTTITQDLEDFLNNDYGKSILANSSVQILMKQGSSEVEILGRTFYLSDAEKQFLQTTQVGEGILFAGQNHIAARFIASRFEYDLITSNPQDILTQQKEAEDSPQAVSTLQMEPQAESPVQNPIITPEVQPQTIVQENSLDLNQPTVQPDINSRVQEPVAPVIPHATPFDPTVVKDGSLPEKNPNLSTIQNT